MPIADEVIVSLEARTAGYNARIAGARRQFERDMLGIRRSAIAAETQTVGAFRGIARSVAGLRGTFIGLGAALVARELQQAADTFTEAGNQIRSAFAARNITEDVDATRRSLVNLAVDTRSSVSATVELFTRLLRSTETINASTQDVTRATEILNKAFQASGASAQEAANGVRQLAQGLASGALQGDELRSIRENAPVIAKAIADAFGTTIGGLKELGAQGKLTAATVFPAILKGGAEIDRQFKQTELTIGKAFQQATSRATQLIGRLSEATGAGEGIANAIAGVGDALEDLGERDVTNINRGLAILNFAFQYTLDAAGAGMQRLVDQSHQVGQAIVDLADTAASVNVRVGSEDDPIIDGSVNDLIEETKRSISEFADELIESGRLAGTFAGAVRDALDVAEIKAERAERELNRLVETFDRLSNLDPATRRILGITDEEIAQAGAAIDDAAAKAERAQGVVRRLGDAISENVLRLLDRLGQEGTVSILDIERVAEHAFAVFPPGLDEATRHISILEAAARSLESQFEQTFGPTLLGFIRSATNAAQGLIDTITSAPSQLPFVSESNSAFNRTRGLAGDSERADRTAEAISRQTEKLLDQLAVEQKLLELAATKEAQERIQGNIDDIRGELQELGADIGVIDPSIQKAAGQTVNAIDRGASSTVTAIGNLGTRLERSISGFASSLASEIDRSLREGFLNLSGGSSLGQGGGIGGGFVDASGNRVGSVGIGSIGAARQRSRFSPGIQGFYDAAGHFHVTGHSGGGGSAGGAFAHQALGMSTAEFNAQQGALRAAELVSQQTVSSSDIQFRQLTANEAALRRFADAVSPTGQSSFEGPREVSVDQSVNPEVNVRVDGVTREQVLAIAIDVYERASREFATRAYLN